MDIIPHANVMPWLVDTDFLLQLALQAGRAVGLLALLGLAYTGVRRALVNHRPDQRDLGNRSTLFASFLREEIRDET